MISPSWIIIYLNNTQFLHKIKGTFSSKSSTLRYSQDLPSFIYLLKSVSQNFSFKLPYSNVKAKFTHTKNYDQWFEYTVIILELTNTCANFNFVNSYFLYMQNFPRSIQERQRTLTLKQNLMKYICSVLQHERL